MNRNRCGVKTKSGEPCRRPAGAGTPHLGSGPCSLHEHGSDKSVTNVYLSSLSAEERAAFARFLESFDLTDIGQELEAVAYTAFRQIVSDPAASPKQKLEALDLLSKVKARHREALEGMRVRVVLEPGGLTEVLELVAKVIAEVVDDEALRGAIARRLEDLAAQYGG